MSREHLFVVIVLSAFVLGACSGTGGAPKLQGAVSEIPVYPKSSYSWQGDGTIYGEGGPWHSRCWFLKLKGTRQEAIDFYRTNLPQAQVELGPGRGGELKEGDAFFVWIPTGCTEDEDVEISISTKEGQDELSICESVHNSKKHLRNK